MEITYHQEPHIPSSTEIGFRLWDMGKLKKFYLTANNGNIYVPEMGRIPEECIFHLCVSAKDFEDAVLELAHKIMQKNGPTELKNPLVEAIKELTDAIKIFRWNNDSSKLLSIIQKLVEK